MDDPETLPLAFFAARFSFNVLLAAVLELFAPPLSLLAMAAPSVARCQPTLSHDDVEGYQTPESGVVALPAGNNACGKPNPRIETEVRAYVRAEIGRTWWVRSGHLCGLHIVTARSTHLSRDIPAPETWGATEPKSAGGRNSLARVFGPSASRRFWSLGDVEQIAIPSHWFLSNPTSCFTRTPQAAAEHEDLSSAATEDGLRAARERRHV